MATCTRVTPVGTVLQPVKKQSVIQLMGSRYWGRVNPLHWDPIYAIEKGLKAPIQTGEMSSCYIQEMLVHFFGENFFRRSRMTRKFVKSIYAGETITTYGTVIEKTPEGDGFRFKVEVGAKNEDGEVKTVGTAECYVE